MDGNIIANSRDITTASGGGSGGSILIHTKVLSGGHTGIVQSRGGSGTVVSGGGSGGRIAIYYRNNDTHHPYRGKFDTSGGSGSSEAEPGASGTVYLKHTGSGFTTLRVSNKGQRAADDEVLNEGVRLDMSGGNFDRSTTYSAAIGVTITSSCGIYSCLARPSCPACQEYVLAHLFDQTFSSGSCSYFRSHCASTKITMDLKRSLFINHIRIYPYCSGTLSDFRVSTICFIAGIDVIVI